MTESKESATGVLTVHDILSGSVGSVSAVGPTLANVREFFCRPDWSPDVTAIGPLIAQVEECFMYPVIVANNVHPRAGEMSKYWPEQAAAGYNNIVYVQDGRMLLRWMDK